MADGTVGDQYTDIMDGMGELLDGLQIKYGGKMHIGAVLGALSTMTAITQGQYYDSIVEANMPDHDPFGG